MKKVEVDAHSNQSAQTATIGTYFNGTALREIMKIR